MAASSQSYDTSINVIGGIQDFSALSEVMTSFFSGDVTPEHLVLQSDIFAVRTEKSRGRIYTALKNSFLNFCDSRHEDLMGGLFSLKPAPADTMLFVFWHLSLNNRLFREISINVFIKYYLSGKAGISKDDIKGFLKDFVVNNKNSLNWSEITIDTLSSKYLNIMVKTGFLEKGLRKRFNHIKISSEALTVFLYFTSLTSSGSNNILSNPFFPACFIPKEDIQERLKKLSLKGLFNSSYNGVEIKIELIHGFKEISNVLYNR